MALYDRRIATRISRERDHRLRLWALIQRLPLSAILDDVIDQALPSADELTARLRDIPEAEAS